MFSRAWNIATTNLEKAVAAHYIARSQPTIAHKLKWDEKALHFALRIDSDEVKALYPSLYLNIAKCHEDLGASDKAIANYDLASSYTVYLTDNGYSKMIKAGIDSGLARLIMLPPSLNK